MKNKFKFYHLTEVLIRICLLLIFLDTEQREPFIRKVQPEEIWLYRNPQTDSYLPSTWLWRMVTFVPLAAILFYYAVRRDQIDLTSSTMVITLAIPLNGVLTNIIKLCVGRCRPDFVYRCWPDGVVPDNAFDSDELTCNGVRDTVMEGRKSFPSGHSSFSFATWGFVFLYVSGKLGTFHCARHPSSSPNHATSPTQTWKLLFSIVMLGIPLVIALSRTADYHHHWQDVLAGSLLGLSTVWVVYRQHYPSISSPDSSYPLLSSYLPIVMDNKMTNNGDHVDGKEVRLQI